MLVKKNIITIAERLQLEPILLTDHPRLAQLMASIYPPVYAHIWKDAGKAYLRDSFSQARLEEDLVNPFVYYYFVLLGGQAIGILKYLLHEPYRESFLKTLKVQRIYLAPATQGKGLGTALLDWLEKEAAAKMEEIWLETMDTQEPAIRFYEKLGYKVLGRSHLESKLAMDEYKGMLLLAKRLNPG